MSRWIAVLGVAVPGFVDATTARAWWSLHVLLVPVAVSREPVVV